MDIQILREFPYADAQEHAAALGRKFLDTKTMDALQVSVAALPAVDDEVEGLLPLVLAPDFDEETVSSLRPLYPVPQLDDDLVPRRQIPFGLRLLVERRQRPG